MSNDLLAKLKGYRNTFVVHSNANRYAAAAAMGAMMGHSQEAGAYFHFSDDLVPAIQAEKAAETPCASESRTLKVDFKDDWAWFLRQTGLPSCGLRFDDSRTLEDNTMRYLNAHNRRIPVPAPRTVHESDELSIPQKYEPDYLALKEAIRSGSDLRPYMSRDIVKKGRPDQNDGLLNSWGIQHLHFRPEGTEHILFCRITATDVFVIQALPHDYDVWVDECLLRILHDNWPMEIARGRINGVSPEKFEKREAYELRGHNANFTTPMADGTVYLAPGGGLMASGDCSEDRLDCHKIFIELDDLQKVVADNEPSIRLALNWSSSERLWLKMAFDNRKYCIYEATAGIRIALRRSDATF